MKPHDPKAIRNVAIVGHGHSGKTSLCSALLFTAGATPRLGRVDDGTATTDYDPEEIEKKISLQLALAHVDWQKTRVNLVDTPGYGNFIYEAKAGLRAVDGAVVLVEGVAGAEVQTEKVWSFCDEFELPRLVVVSRMDRENASAGRALDSAEKKLGRGIVPIQIPIGSEKDFRGVVDLVEMKAWLYERDGSGKAKSADVPDELRKEAEEARRRLLEMVAELDDALMAKYLETETLETAEFVDGLVRAVAARKIVPAVLASGTLNLGTAQVLDAILKYLPSPEGRRFVGKSPKDGSEVVRTSSADAAPSAFVFKTLADPYTGKLSLVRMMSGHLAASDPLYNASRDVPERFGGFLDVQGKATSPVPEAVAGDIVAIAKLKETTTNDTLGGKDHSIVYPPIEFPEPAMSFALEPKTRGDEDKLATALARISEEDPTIHFGRDPQTHELLISGMGDTHIEVVVAKLHKKFGVDVVLHTPKVPYRETIKRKVEMQGRHKKQTGGRGQFGDCWIRLEPLGRGEGFVFEDEIFGGSVPQNYRPAVEKGVIDSAARGYLAGFPVVDFKCTLFDGSYHAVDSSELAFKLAGSLAFRKAMEQAKPILLEPVMHVTVQGPEDSMGDLIGQLNARRGRIQGMEGGVVTAQVPMSEMLTFAPILKSLTSGRGNYHMEFSHYDEVPALAAQKIIDAAKKPTEAHDEDE